MTIQCVSCGGHSDADANFCEHCGIALSVQDEGPATAAAPACKACGAQAIDAQGYCEACGMRQVQAPARELTLGPDLAVISDIGRRHATNQDDGSVLRLPDGSVLLAVADGVSTAQHSEDAAQLAVHTALAHVAQGYGSKSAGQLLVNAVLAADQAVKTLPYDSASRLAEPQATLLLALVQGNRVHRAWVGDSRLYALEGGTTQQLTRDDSWLSDALDAGMAEADALKSPHAHAITQCLGMRDDPLEVNVQESALSRGALVLACTDGFWNYCDSAADVGRLVHKFGTHDTLTLSRHLVAHANHCGGRDNITVAAYRLAA